MITVLNTDAWSEEARRAAVEARKRKGGKVRPSKIPKEHIQWVVNRYEVTKPESEVRAEFTERMSKAGPEWSEEKKREAIEYAVAHQRKRQQIWKGLK